MQFVLRVNYNFIIDIIWTQPIICHYSQKLPWKNRKKENFIQR